MSCSAQILAGFSTSQIVSVLNKPENKENFSYFLINIHCISYSSNFGIRAGQSFDGKFESKYIRVFNRTMVMFDTSVMEVNFTASSCSNDFLALYKILPVIFSRIVENILFITSTFLDPFI